MKKFALTVILIALLPSHALAQESLQLAGDLNVENVVEEIMYYDGTLAQAKKKQKKKGPVVDATGLYSGVMRNTKIIPKAPPNVKLTCRTDAAYNAQFYVEQAGRKITIHTPSGVLFKGKANRKGFKTKAKIDNTVQKVKGSKIKATSAKITVDVLQKLSYGATCRYIFVGTLERS